MSSFITLECVLLLRTMVTINLTRYRFGLVIGVVSTLGAVGLFEGLEILLFGGLLIEWTTRKALISTGVGGINIILALILYRWYRSISEVMEVENKSEDV